MNISLVFFYDCASIQLLIRHGKLDDLMLKMSFFRSSSSTWRAQDVDPYHNRGEKTFGSRSEEYSGKIIIISNNQ